MSAGKVGIGYTLDIHKEHLLDKSGLITLPVLIITERDVDILLRLFCLLYMFSKLLKC
jgi:hypothetical protein